MYIKELSVFFIIIDVCFAWNARYALDLEPGNSKYPVEHVDAVFLHAVNNRAPD